MSNEPPTPPLLRARYERRRHEVVDAAARVFAQRGFHATSVQDLVAATGLAAGGLYHYIGSKDRLLVQICDELMDPLLEEAAALVARDDLGPEGGLGGVGGAGAGVGRARRGPPLAYARLRAGAPRHRARAAVADDPGQAQGVRA